MYMVNMVENFLALTPSLPIILAFALPLISLVVKSRRVWESYTITASFIILLLALTNFMRVYEVGKPLIYKFGGWPPPIGIVYEVDLLGALMGLLVASIMFLIAIYSVKYLEHAHGVEWYYTLLLGVEAGMLGCVYTGDAFNLFVMLEVTSVAAYGLVAFYRSNKEAIEAALKYAIVGSIATTVYFISLAFLYGTYGTLNMADIIAKSKLMVSPELALISGIPVANIIIGAAIILALAIWAFTVKAAAFPNHFWLPDAHPAAPTPISAVLSGLVVKVGVYAVIRFSFTIFGGAELLSNVISVLYIVLLILGIFSAFVASMLMVVQTDIKRLIAYSTVMHIGLIFMGIGLGTPLGLAAAIYHTINHAVAKALLFLAAGVFIYTAKTRNIDELAGIGRYMPLSTFTFIIAALALVGIPPLNGFMSKLTLYYALIDAGLAPLVVVIIVTSALALLAYVKIVYSVWLKAPLRDYSDVKEAHPLMLVPLLILALTCIVLGVTAPLLMDKLIMPTVKATLNSDLYVKVALEALRKFLSS